MLNAFKLIWNFSSKRKKEYRNAIIFSFLEGLFAYAAQKVQLDRR